MAGSILPISIKLETYQKDSLELLKIIQPNWNLNTLKFKMFSGGITNVLFLVSQESDTALDDGINVRIFGEGSDKVIDRDAEIIAINALEKAELGVKLYARFTNGIAYSFLKGITLDEKTVRDPHIGSLVAKSMVDMHKIDSAFLKHHGLDFPLHAKTFSRIRNWLEHVPTELKDPNKNERLHKEVPSIEALGKELDEIEAHCLSLNSPIVFGHNDILLGNIIYNEEKDTVKFIDYEYAGFTYEAFDLGNHFCEWAGVDDLDFARYPDKDIQLPWLRKYLEHKKEAYGDADKSVSDLEVETLYVQVNKFALVGHFHWGVWALLQQRFSLINFDYIDYAVMKLNEYFAKKKEFMALEIPK